MTYVNEELIYSEPKVKRTVMENINDWLGITFESSSGKTEQFKAFSRMFRATVKKQCNAKGLTIVSWLNGHFECSAFVKNDAGKYAYLSISDVRHFPNGWYNDILIRTAEHDKDYTGGTNNSATVENLGEKLLKLTN